LILEQHVDPVVRRVEGHYPVTTNMIERLHGEFRRRVKTQGSLPTEDAALVLSSGSSSAARSGCAARRGRQILHFYASAAGQRHDALRAAVRIAFDGHTYTEDAPNRAFPAVEPRAMLVSHLDFDGGSL
jgi:hypothetical protein